MSAGSSKACNCSFLMSGRPLVVQTQNKTRFCQSIEARTDLVTRLQVPPRAPKKYIGVDGDEATVEATMTIKYDDWLMGEQSQSFDAVFEMVKEGNDWYIHDMKER